MVEIKKERLKNLSDYNIPNAGLSDEEIKQILQDHEDAKKYNAKWKEVEELENDPNIESVTMSYAEVKQAPKDRQIVKRLEELDLPYIIQLLKEYGFIVCDTTECRTKVAEQNDKLQKILGKKNERY